MATTGYDIIGRQRDGSAVMIEHTEATFGEAMAMAVQMQRDNAEVEVAAVYYDWLGQSRLLYKSELPWRP